VSPQHVAGLYIKDGTSLPSFSNEVPLRGTKRREEGNAQQPLQQPVAEEPPPKSKNYTDIWSGRVLKYGIYLFLSIRVAESVQIWYSFMCETGY
jgi:hypothetical protein